ncbi:MAG: sodium-dependent bicarbonate transport family permease [Pirellulaceae bacterium]
MTLFHEFWDNFVHNLFKPLLLFFYLGFSIPLLKVTFEFPYVIYQGLTIYLLLAIGWHGGEELASLSTDSLRQALGFVAVGFCTNFCIGIVAYFILRRLVGLRKIDAATIAGYYGSDSAGTFVTCVGVLTASSIAFAPYMPVMLAVMEIPGCLVALFLVSRLRRQGLDARGNTRDEPGFDANGLGKSRVGHELTSHVSNAERPQKGAAASYGSGQIISGNFKSTENRASDDLSRAIEFEAEMSLEKIEHQPLSDHHVKGGMFNKELLHEVFLNPGIYLLFGGILIGFISRLQGAHVTDKDDLLFVKLFEGVLCLFLLEMGITASRRLLDLKQAGWRFIVYGLVTPNIFATVGIFAAHAYAMATGANLELGTYVLFAVLCGSASYIAVPAVQRLAIPEASPTLPLAASLGLTFSYNVTIGIPLYIMIAKLVTTHFHIS